ncbi:nucleotidyltransferase domain-containing protein [Geobacter sp.]|uniref:nucleotidyltransferase domain-containing protein n=1 Tax=Geobacter sp. TaxID=46610 RepID=UPI0027B98E1A|nr:nucleotidyltransferase domain-containing protein [Geobacter sp.]
MRRDDRIRHGIAQEAARLMYEEGVREYRDAKRKAARQFGPEKALSLGSHLPSNAEIHGELQRLIGLHEEGVLPERLLRLRLAALRLMEILEPFRPYLVGSVLTGAVTERSDIDLHLFADSHEEVEDFLRGEGIAYEQEVVTIRHGGEFFEYPHIYLEDEGVVVECTVYPLEDIHRIPKSSITGRPMERATAKKLRKLIADEGQPPE